MSSEVGNYTGPNLANPQLIGGLDENGEPRSFEMVNGRAQVDVQIPPVKYAIGNIAASQTDATLTRQDDGTPLLGVQNKRILIVSLFALAGATATALTFNTALTGGTGVAISPLLANGANGGLVLPLNPAGWFKTRIHQGPTVTTGSGATTGIMIGYLEIDP